MVFFSFLGDVILTSIFFFKGNFINKKSEQEEQRKADQKESTKRKKYNNPTQPITRIYLQFSQIETTPDARSHHQLSLCIKAQTYASTQQYFLIVNKTAPG